MIYLLTPNCSKIFLFKDDFCFWCCQCNKQEIVDCSLDSSQAVLGFRVVGLKVVAPGFRRSAGEPVAHRTGLRRPEPCPDEKRFSSTSSFGRQKFRKSSGFPVSFRSRRWRHSRSPSSALLGASCLTGSSVGSSPYKLRQIEPGTCGRAAKASTETTKPFLKKTFVFPHRFYINIQI